MRISFLFTVVLSAFALAIPIGSRTDVALAPQQDFNQRPLVIAQLVKSVKYLLILQVSTAQVNNYKGSVDFNHWFL